MVAADWIPGVKQTIAVASGKGGVGKSTVSVNLAVALAQSGATVGLMDADAYGPNIPGMMGIEEAPVAQGQQLVPVERHGVKVISTGFFVKPDQPVIWRGPMLHSLVQQFLRDVAWGALEYLVIDLPPGTGDVQLSLSQVIPLTGAVIVTTPQTVAVSDVVRAIAMFRKVNVPILGVIENMQTYRCAHCGQEEEIFGRGGALRVSEQFDVPLLGGVPLAPRVCREADAGQPIVVAEPDGAAARAFRQIAGAVIDRVKALETSSSSPERLSRVPDVTDAGHR